MTRGHARPAALKCLQNRDQLQHKHLTWLPSEKGGRRKQSTAPLQQGQAPVIPAQDHLWPMPKVSGSLIHPLAIKEFLILQPTNTATTGVSSSSRSWNMSVLMANNDMDHQQRPCFLSLIWSLINGIMHHFYSKPFLSGLKNSLLNVLIQCLCINTISLFRFIYNKAILTSIHRKLCSGFNNVSFHSGIHRWLKPKN